MALNDITGKTFQGIEVLERAGTTPHQRPTWLCKCHCGKISVLPGRGLIDGKTKHCGCKGGSPHGYTGHPLYDVWKGMKLRCYRKTNKRAYKAYGARGIRVCEEWHDPKIFIEWCLSNGYEKGKHLDRIDPNGNYEPGNCRFRDASDNSRDQRCTVWHEWNGRKWTAAQLAKICTISESALRVRLTKFNMTVEEALSLGSDPWEVRRFLQQREQSR